MNLYLVRHAEPRPGTEDPEQSLSEKGWSDIRKVATFICKHANIKINSIRHSPKTRARQTAEVLAECLNPPEGAKEATGLKPLDDPLIWAEHLSQIKEDIMLVGHLPHLNRLSSQLLCQNKNTFMINFQAAGVFCLERDETNNWSVCWMIVPQIL